MKSKPDIITAFQVLSATDVDSAPSSVPFCFEAKRVAERYARNFNRRVKRDQDRYVVRDVTAIFGGDRFRVVLIDAQPTNHGWPIRFEPRHALDVPPAIHDEIEQRRPMNEFISREKALRLVSRTNARRIRAAATLPDLNRWAIALEFGEFVGKPLSFLEMAPGMVGIESFHYSRPFRLIDPTADELDQYAPDHWEWSVAADPDERTAERQHD